MNMDEIIKFTGFKKYFLFRFNIINIIMDIIEDIVENIPREIFVLNVISV